MATKRNVKPTERQLWMAEHANLHPKEALKLAKQRWPKITMQSIYQARNHMRRRGIDVPRLGSALIKHPERYNGIAAPGKPRGHRRKTLLTMFVLSLPMDMPGPEVVQRAKAAGHKLALSSISSIRRRHRGKLDPQGPQPPAQLVLADAQPETQAEPVTLARRPRKTRQEPTVMPLGALNSDELDLMGLVLNIGYNRAASLLARFRVQFFGALKAQSTDTDHD